MCKAAGMSPCSKLKGVGGVGVPGSWYDLILRKSEKEEIWFGMDDCSARMLRVLVAYYWLAICYPFSFFYFLVRYNMLWEGTACGLFFTVCFYPVYPFAALFLLLAKKALLPERAYEKGNVFFDPPKSALGATVWNWYKALSPPVAQFLFNRGDSTAIAHSWWDYITHKDFWRAHLERVGARVPRCLGRWVEKEPGVYGVEWMGTLGKEDVVIKVLDESNGIGDAFLLNGDGPGMIDGAEAVEKFLSSQSAYQHTSALILEWIRPAAGQEVHTLDILTVAKPDGEIELVTLLYWGDCANGKTSHTTRAGYVVDAAKEEISATCKWYAPGFAGMTPKLQYSIGHKLPGVAAATQLMVEAHKSAMLEQPWLKMIGWDAMISHGGPPVFFEGNYAQMRTPRRVFLTWETMWHCLRTFS
eukprot:Transcript_1732.p2 GENE.Transcript_1732~~Transcript_1732.p2  ORF type:complete len:454 (+),score=180.88 Transcript_1732:119-1363(+)